LEIHNLKQHDTARKKDEEIHLIIYLLKLLVLVPKTGQQRSWLGHEISMHLYNYEVLRTENKESYLLRDCKEYKGKLFDFYMIKLLLSSDSNTNAVGANSLSPLHLLAQYECEDIFYLRQISFKGRSEQFYDITKKNLGWEFCMGQRDYRGKSALEFFAPYNVRQQYSVSQASTPEILSRNSHILQATTNTYSSKSPLLK
jgi:hypothetical protein